MDGDFSKDGIGMIILTQLMMNGEILQYEASVHFCFDFRSKMSSRIQKRQN